MSNTTETARPSHLNIRVDGEFWDAIDTLRALRKPIPSTSDLIRALVLQARDAEAPAKRRKPKS